LRVFANFVKISANCFFQFLERQLKAANIGPGKPSDEQASKSCRDQGFDARLQNAMLKIQLDLAGIRADLAEVRTDLQHELFVNQQSKTRISSTSERSDGTHVADLQKVRK
jgi:hypothetical protein